MKTLQLITLARSRAWLLFASLLAACAFAGEARAQDSVLPPQPAPPPMRYVPELERAQLVGINDAGDRVRASLNLLEERLAHAERNTAAGHFDPAAADLGIYEALLDDVLQFLKPIGRSPDGKKVDTRTRDLYKRIEQTLNKQTARIESIRRLTPQDYQGNVREAFLYTRDRRTECLDAFFGANVLREPPPEMKETKQEPTENITKESPDAQQKTSAKPPTS
jgi:hypothetical protein